jgi:DNA-binding Lrp family transcriptional regulator
MTEIDKKIIELLRKNGEMPSKEIINELVRTGVIENVKKKRLLVTARLFTLRSKGVLELAGEKRGYNIYKISKNYENATI